MLMRGKSAFMAVAAGFLGVTAGVGASQSCYRYEYRCIQEGNPCGRTRHCVRSIINAEPGVCGKERPGDNIIAIPCKIYEITYSLPCGQAHPYFVELQDCTAGDRRGECCFRVATDSGANHDEVRIHELVGEDCNCPGGGEQ